MLSFIPIIGPIITGITSLFSKWFDVQTVKIQTDAAVKTVETQESTKIIQATHDDWGIRMARDIIIWPWAAWSGAIGWDTLIAKTHPEWMLHPVDVPPGATWGYIPYAVIVFLLGNIGINMWNRK